MSRIAGPAFAYVVDLPKTQDATRIPEGWNVQWERLCAQGANIPSQDLPYSCYVRHIQRDIRPILYTIAVYL